MRLICAQIALLCSLFVQQLRLKNFANELGLDSQGDCCSGHRKSRNSVCDGVCRTKFRVCLKHYLAVIDPNDPCTFGDTVTPVIANNSINFIESNLSRHGFKNPIVFPFEISLPKTFSLIIEAWHEGILSDDLSVPASPILISRLSAQRWLRVQDKWTSDQHKTGHVTLSYEYRVRCALHYYGDACNDICRPRNDKFGHYTCSESGNKICLSGWSGEYCDKAICSPGCHPEYGSCDNPNECRCKMGWQGPLCDQCVTYPGCQHGTCEKSWECICHEGWGGLFCNQDLNYCTNHKPCQNGGTCFNTGQGSFTCSCPESFTGATCETEINHCAGSPCLNGGTCYGIGANYSCSCVMGWHGRHCETKANSCNDKPCKHGGICTDSKEGYHCHCQSGFGGANCEKQLDLCNPSPCKNGQCRHKGSDYRCVCFSGFTGLKCDVNVNNCIEENLCFNGGTCIDLVNSFKCSCSPGFFGARCQTNINDCLSKPCANGGRCIDLIDDFQCICPPGFAGKNCSTPVSTCDSNLCKNGGTCIIGKDNSVECLCSRGYFGVICEIFDNALWFANSTRMGSNEISNKISAFNGDQSLSPGQLALIGTLSAAVPIMALVSVTVIICMKGRRKRDRKKADDEARRENVENAVHCIMNNKCSLERHSQIIVNNLDYSATKTNNSQLPFHHLCFQVDDSDYCLKDSIGYVMHKARSSKILNSDPILRTSTLSEKCDYDPQGSYSKTVASDPVPYSKIFLNDMKNSSLSINVDSTHCPSDSTLYKTSLDRDINVGSPTPSSCSSSPAVTSNSVYVINDHFSEAMFATEV